MFIKLSVMCVLMHVSYVRNERLNWELAVVVGNEISLLHTDGTIIETKTQPFSSLKALAFDNVRDQFIVSDMDMKNDTIYTVQLSKETETTVPIINGLPGDVQGFAVDPIEDVLYWTDAINHTINYVFLNETTFEPKEFLVFDEEVPHALAIDICKRHLYFTNPGHKPTIERINLDKSDREIIVDNLIMSPVGLTIDYKAQKLYWVDSRIGTSAGRIESINLDGTGRRLVFEKNTMEPFGIAVDEEAIYWTDTNNNALYSLSKNKNTRKKSVKLLGFSDKPMGLVANNNIVNEEPDCSALEAAIKEYGQKSKEADPISTVEKDVVKECLNGGELEGNHCVCKRGFTGTRCETSVCSDLFCLSGNCYLSTLGQPRCRCKRGFIGDRCQKNKCDGFCLNGGECGFFVSTSDLPKCRCAEGYVGDRCEYDVQVCETYCRNRSDEAFSEKYDLLCRCFSASSKDAALSSSTDQQDLIGRLKDPVVYLSAVVLFCLSVIVALVVYIRTTQKKRPRVKKRIIVNKNVTPLTLRPQPSTEQCEITIENCCNMNICETPCFEPREDKKKLLTNMEGDELY